LTTIHYQGKSYQCRDDETVLDAMLRQGVDFPFSCRSGVCHICLHRAESGRLPPEAQKGLDATQQEEGLFLPCRCRPVEDLVVVSPQAAAGAAGSACSASSTKTVKPDPEMWQALQEGALLSRILEDFYGGVYEDERLAPFFEGVTKQRAIEKQFLFLRQLITGEKVYFGDRPRNAHHWMVISNELFDYREQLMLDCLRRHGLAEPLVQRWRAMEEQFRADIVKEEPWKRKMGDVELPVDGYEETVLDVGSLCDGCGAEIDAGVEVRYHLRLGSIYCPTCM
jgi:ferredoxin/truncated hemoglobin YjbI